jgi:hypothetical protein
MKKNFLLFFVAILMSGCYITYKTPQSRRGTRPFFYSPRTHHGPFYKHPKPKQMKPHFNKELPR